MDRYGKNEWLFASPIADALVKDAQFRQWMISKTVLRNLSIDARLLWEEQKSRRTLGSETWWRSYWTGSSYLFRAECGERETDLLAIFKTPDQLRFALHIEVKAPGDKFGINQARDYSRRAICWKGRYRAPRTVLPHDDATTVLCCNESFARSNPDTIGFFDSVVYHEEIGRQITPFPLTA